MNQVELDEIKNLPDKYRPLTAWAYFGYSILFALPGVGFILTIVFSLVGSNINRRSFARSYFCVWIILIIASIIFFILGAMGKITIPSK